MNTFQHRFSLVGKTAVITGGAGRLGYQHARALADCGANVILWDISVPALDGVLARLRDEFPGHPFHGAMVDITQPETVREGLQQILQLHGGINILVNNASIDPKVKDTGDKQSLLEASRFEWFPLNEWQRQIDVGLTGAFLCSQVLGAWMADHGGGVILNIASDLSVIAPDQRLYRKEHLPETQQPKKPVTYSVIKTALLGLTRYLASYWATQQVRVNALSPGGIFTDEPEEFVNRLTNLIPMGRMASHDEYISAIQFLCSDASNYMTGQNIVMDGGRTIL